jgi:sortase A
MGRNIVRIIIAALILSVILIPVAASEDVPAISIPAINVNASIVSVPLKQFHDGSVTWDTSRLYGSVGHFDGTAWFGESGRIVLGGHSENARYEPDVFYQLDQVQVGDEIIVKTGGSELHYQVTELITVEEADLSVLEAQGSEQLVLMTCDISSYTGGGRYTRRVVIIASRI